jgi:hypothetical protein
MFDKRIRKPQFKTKLESNGHKTSGFKKCKKVNKSSLTTYIVGISNAMKIFHNIAIFKSKHRGCTFRSTDNFLQRLNAKHFQNQWVRCPSSGIIYNKKTEHFGN